MIDEATPPIQFNPRISVAHFQMEVFCVGLMLTDCQRGKAVTTKGDESLVLPAIRSEPQMELPTSYNGLMASLI
jgi:hypothetical protein